MKRLTITLILLLLAPATWGTLAQVAPYGETAETGLPQWGTGNNASREFLTVRHTNRIRQNGTLSRVSFWCAGNTALTACYITVWRKDGATYDRAGISENIAASMVAGQTVTVDLASPITGVLEGDYIGYRVERSEGGVYQFDDQTVAGTNTRYVTNTAPATADYDWDGATGASNYVVIQAYMTAPVFVGIGDSIMAGHPAHYGYCEATATEDLDGHLCYLLSQLWQNKTWQNMGIGSQTTTDLAARVTTDLVNLAPAYALLEGGINDIVAIDDPSNAGQVATAKAVFLTKWTALLDACDGASITPVVMLMFPWTNGTNTEMQVRDDWNASLTTLAAEYTGAVVVDCGSTIGQNRADGDPGNLWDLQAAYNADGIHLTVAGYTAVAGAVRNALKPTAATTPDPADDATDVAVDATLSWAAVATAETYDVYLDDVLVSNDQAITSYDPPADFIPYSEHTWRVDANNAAGTTTGTQWSFQCETKGGAGALLSLLAF